MSESFSSIAREYGLLPVATSLNPVAVQHVFPENKAHALADEGRVWRGRGRKKKKKKKKEKRKGKERDVMNVIRHMAVS